MKSVQAPVYLTNLDCIQDAIVSSRLRLRTQNRICEPMCILVCLENYFFPLLFLTGTNYHKTLSRPLVSVYLSLK